MVNGQLNNAVGMQTGKTLFTKTHNAPHSPSITVPAVDSPAHSEAGKWTNTSPGTGYTQKQKIENPKEHSKAVKEGVKNLPALGLTGAAAVTGALPIIGAAAGTGALAAGAGWIAEKVFGKNPFPWGKDK